MENSSGATSSVELVGIMPYDSACAATHNIDINPNPKLITYNTNNYKYKICEKSSKDAVKNTSGATCSEEVVGDRHCESACGAVRDIGITPNPKLITQHNHFIKKY